MDVSRLALSRLSDFIASQASNPPSTASAGAEREALLPLLHAYKRLLHILPAGEEGRALGMLEDGLHSAIQIAGMAREEFLARWAARFPGEETLGETVYNNAVARRSYVLLEHVKSVQTDEPHYQAARFR